MSSETVSIVLYYDGELNVVDDFFPTYIGGKNRPIQIPRRTNLLGLQKRIMRSLKLDHAKSCVNLIGRYPIGAGFIATHITDDEVCESVLNAASVQPVVIYVEVQELNCGERDVAITEEHHRASISDEFITLDLHETVQQEAYIAMHAEAGNVAGTSSAIRHDAEGDVGDGYETMPYATSTDDDEWGDSDADESSLRGKYSSSSVRELIKDYSFRTSQTEECLLSNNEYMRHAQTTREWDEEQTFDGPSDESTFVLESRIPDELYEGMCFIDKKQLLFAVQGWSIINNVEYVSYASNKSKFTILCTQYANQATPCRWRLHASSSKRLGGTWRIGSLSTRHTCSHSVLSAGHRQCTAQFISYFIQPAIRRHLDLKPREIIGRFEAKFNIRVSYMKAWDARRKALKVIFGSWEESYQSLDKFMSVICSAMPGSVYRVQCSESYRFQRLFWSFEPSISGWLYCRPVLCLDGTFLLGKYRGTLLTAVGIDANNGLFPLAFAVVESESIESWCWFIQTLRELVPLICTRGDLCIISDRHAGLVRGCKEILPWVAHRFCLRHLRENFKKTVRQLGIRDVEFICQKMYVAGNTDDIRIFKRFMTDIKNIRQEAYDWLIARDVHQWSLTHDDGYRYGTMTTNAAECFNSVLKRARGLPIQALVSAIYYNIVATFMKRLDSATSIADQHDSMFSPRTKATLQNSEHEARRFPDPIRINNNEYQVFASNNRTYKVELYENHMSRCTCRQPQAYHMPCPHVISVLGQRHISHVPYVSTYYTLDYYCKTYEGTFHVIPDRDEWPEHITAANFPDYTPPNIKRKSGRPRSLRFRNTMDENTTSSNRTCSLCKNSDHNRATCPQGRRSVS